MLGCSNCGCRISSKEKFCNFCGTQIDLNKSKQLNELQNSDKNKSKLVIAGILQILFGLIGLGRLTLLHLTRSTFHFCLTLLALFFIGLSQLEQILIDADITMLILLSEQYSQDLVLKLGKFLLLLNVILSVIDGVILIKSSKVKSSSCCLGFFGFIGNYVLLTILITIISLFSLNAFTFGDMATYESRQINSSDYLVESIEMISDSEAEIKLYAHVDIKAILVYIEYDDGSNPTYVNLINLQKDKSYKFTLEVRDQDASELNFFGIVIDYDKLNDFNAA